jgi:predicted Rossmann-fold nucleotide-binding protein
MIAIGGGYGTLSEIAFVLRLRKPLALIDSWEFSHASMADDPLPAAHLRHR